MAASAAPRATGQCFDKIVETLERLEEDQTLLVQSGKPVGVFRTHKDAPRVLIANSNLVPKWANWEVFNELDRKGLMMYGQMTAGSWIYIGTQGIVQGTYETFAEMGRQHYGGDLKGKLDPDRGPRRHGRRAAARGGHGRRALHRHRGARKAASRSGSRPATSTGARPASTRRWRSSAPPTEPTSVGLLGNAAEILPEMLDARHPARCAHRPDQRPRSRQRLLPGRLERRQMAGDARARSRRRRRGRASSRWRAHVEAMLAYQGHGRSDLRLRQQHPPGSLGRGRRPTPSISPASSRPMSARCSAAASARSAGSRSAAIPRTSTAPTPR